PREKISRGSLSMAPKRTTRSLADVLPRRPALVVFDFDGVFTDNSVYVCEDGREWVRCSRGDGMGITLLKATGIAILVLSSESNPVVTARCRKLGIECIQAASDKCATLKRSLEERGIAASETVFVGNDVNDIECLTLAGCGVVVADAHPEARAVADAVLRRP